MGRFQKMTVGILALILMSLILVACGGSATKTPAPAATTAVKPTTAAAATTPASGGNRRPAPSGTPTGSGKMPANVPASAASPVDTLLANVTKASSTVKSVRIDLLAQTETSQLDTKVVFVEPDRVQMDLTANGQQVDVVQIGTNLWLGTGGTVQKVTDPTTITQYVAFLNAINLVVLGDNDLKKYAGSDMVIYPTQKGPDGKDYGVFYIDTTNAADADVKTLGNAIYFYDPQTYQIQLVILQNSTTDLLMTLTDINNTSLKVEEPK